LTEYSDLAGTTTNPGPLVPAQTIASMVWAAGIVTVTMAAPITPTYAANDVPQASISGVTPSAFNYSGPITITDSTHFTYPLSVSPGTVTIQGVMQPQLAIELSQMASTFFSQGNMVTVWVLELGWANSITANASALQTWLNINPRSFYGYLLPRLIGSTSVDIQAFEAIFKQYQAPESMTYFWLTVTPVTTAILDTTYKDVIQFIEAPTVTDTVSGNRSNPQGEFTAAAMFYNAMAYLPSNINTVAPMAFKYLYGVTAYPTQNQGPTLVQFKRDFTNYVSTGAEGGIAYNIVYEGVTRDGYDYFNWWWTIDWVQINVNLNLSNAIINGSNNALAPLYYNQPGINFLETVLFNTMNSAATFGMVLGRLTMTELDGPALINAINQGTFAGQCDVNAVPFINYALANPGHYKIGEYDGLSTLFIPARGFIHILVLITASSLVSV
jgi:hypothetical protein